MVNGEYLTPADAAAVIGCDLAAIAAAIEAGTIRGRILDDGRFRIRSRDVIRVKRLRLRDTQREAAQ